MRIQVTDKESKQELKHELKQESYTVYVPQGRSARLQATSKAVGIEGLFTDDFTSCCIIACIGKDKLTLTHMDAINYPKALLKEDIEWVGEPSEIIVIHTKSCPPAFPPMRLSVLRKEFPSKRFIPKTIDDGQNGVYISFDKNEKLNLLHPQIKLYLERNRPANLLHHPLEQPLQTVQKIENLIGLKSRYKTKLLKAKQPFIFDSQHWLPIDLDELTINCIDAETQKEIELFKKDDTYILIASKAHALYKSAMAIGIPIAGDTKADSYIVATHIEAYLNDYDCDAAFKRNMKDLLNCGKLIPKTPADKELRTKILKALDDKEAFEVVFKIFLDCKKETEYQQNIAEEHQYFSDHYNERKYYKNVAARYSQKHATAMKVSGQATKLYREKKYEAAANLFFVVMRELAHCCLIDNDDIAKSYYNLGRCYFQLGEFEKAHSLLKQNLYLRQNKVDSLSKLPPMQIRALPKDFFVSSAAEIEKAKLALQECQQKLSASASSSKTAAAYPI